MLKAAISSRASRYARNQGRNHVFKVGGVQFLGLGYYYSSTEKQIDKSTQFGAIGYISHSIHQKAV